MTRNIHQDFVDFMGAYFGYGYGSEAEYFIPALKMFFELLKDGNNYDHKSIINEFGGLAAWLLINILCGADILEYGISPKYGWLSEKGEMLRDYLANKTVDDLIVICNSIDVDCGLDYCNCDNGKYHDKTEPCQYNKFFRK